MAGYFDRLPDYKEYPLAVLRRIGSSALRQMKIERDRYTEIGMEVGPFAEDIDMVIDIHRPSRRRDKLVLLGVTTRHYPTDKMNASYAIFPLKESKGGILSRTSDLEHVVGTRFPSYENMGQGVATTALSFAPQGAQRRK